MALDFAKLGLGDLKNEADTVLGDLIKALDGAEKFDFLFPQLKPELEFAIKALTAAKAILDKLP